MGRFGLRAPQNYTTPMGGYAQGDWNDPTVMQRQSVYGRYPRAPRGDDEGAAPMPAPRAPRFSMSPRDNPNGPGVMQPARPVAFAPAGATPQQQPGAPAAASVNPFTTVPRVRQPAARTTHAEGGGPQPVMPDVEYKRLKDQYDSLGEQYDAAMKDLNDAGGGGSGPVPPHIMDLQTRRDALASRLWPAGGIPMQQPPSAAQNQPGYFVAAPGSPGGVPQPASGTQTPAPAAPFYVAAPGAPYQPNTGGTPAYQPPQPAYRQPGAGSPIPEQLPSYMQRNPNTGRITVDKTSPEHQKNIRTMYKSARAGTQRQSAEVRDAINRGPQDTARLAEIEAAQAMQGGMATQANAMARGAQMAGNGALYGEIAANELQRKTQNKSWDREKSDIRARQKIADPETLRQNETTLNTIDARLGQFQQGNYDLSQYPEGQVFESPSTGRRFKTVNGQLMEL